MKIAEMLWVNVQEETSDEARKNLERARAKFSKAQTEANHAESEFKRAYQVTEDLIEGVTEEEVLQCKADLPMLRQRAQLAASKVKGPEREQREAEDRLRPIIDSERRAGLKEKVTRMFKVAEEAEAAAKELRAYEDETYRLDGSKPGEGYCPALLVGFDFQREEARKLGLLD